MLQYARVRCAPDFDAKHHHVFARLRGGPHTEPSQPSARACFHWVTACIAYMFGGHHHYGACSCRFMVCSCINRDNSGPPHLMHPPRTLQNQYKTQVNGTWDSQSQLMLPLHKVVDNSTLLPSPTRYMQFVCRMCELHVSLWAPRYLE